MHYLRHLLPPSPEALKAEDSRVAPSNPRPSTFAKRHAVGFLQPRESVCKVGSATTADYYSSDAKPAAT